MCGVKYECSYVHVDGKAESFADEHITSTTTTTTIITTVPKCWKRNNNN